MHDSRDVLSKQCIFVVTQLKPDGANISIRCDNMMMIVGAEIRRCIKAFHSSTCLLYQEVISGMVLWGSQESVYVIQQSD